MEFNELLASLGKKLGLELSADADGACVLGVDDRMSVTIQNLDELARVAVWAKIGEPPPQGLERLLSAMLEANHLFQGTGGATISRDSAGDFFLCQLFELRALEDDPFFTALERFVNTLEAWQRLLEDYRPEAVSTPTDSVSPPAFDGNGFMAV